MAGYTEIRTVPAASVAHAQLLPRERGTQQILDPDAVRHIVLNYAAKAELADMHPHTPRHTAATLAIRDGVPLVTVQRMLGHVSLLTTEMYLHAAAD